MEPSASLDPEPLKATVRGEAPEPGVAVKEDFGSWFVVSTGSGLMMMTGVLT